MLDTTKPIKLLQSYIDSRGNHYPPKEQAYLPGELPESAWKFKHAVQIESENNSEIAEEIKTSLDSEFNLEITEPSIVREIKPTQENLVPSTPKEIKPRTYKHVKNKDVVN